MHRLTNTELLNALHEAANNLSYYNAAEGPSWRAETNARGAARQEWDELQAEAKSRGIFNAEDFKRYLV